MTSFAARQNAVKDSGYSWVILTAVFVEYSLVAMGLGSVGVLYPEFIQHFQCSKFQSGWIGSLNSATGAFVG